MKKNGEQDCSKRPNCCWMFVSAYTLANWCKNSAFKFSQNERDLIERILDRGFTLEPSCLNDLHSLRILFWQVVGSKRS